MRIMQILTLAMTGFMATACTSTEWVHPTKDSSEFANDYNRCENMVLRDPKLQQGIKFMTVQATERCVQKEGWYLVEKN